MKTMKHKTVPTPSNRSKFLALFSFYLLLFSCNLPKVDDTTLVPTGLKAQFTATPSSGNAPLTVAITNTSEEAVGFAWSFGDGATSVAENPGTHLYANPGNYEIRLIATDDQGNKDTAMATIIVSAPGVKPVAGFTISNNGCTGPCPVQFLNTSTNGASFSWNFGDPDSGGDNNSSEVSPTHAYTQPGTYSVKLVAVNGAESDSITQLVTISGIKFEKTFAGYGPGAKARQLSDNGFIIGGTQNSNAYLIRTDASGNIVNQKIYAGYDALVNDVIQLSDGSFVAVGSSFNAANNTTDFFYLRVGADLNELTGPTRFGETNGDEEAKSVIELTDGSVLITGYSTITTTALSDVYVARYSPTLTTSYFKNRIVAPDDEIGLDAVQISDGFIIVGDYYTSTNPSNGLFLRLDNNGAKLSGYPKAVGGANAESAKSVVKLSETELMLGGLIIPSIGSQSDIWLQKVNLTGGALGAAITFGSAGDDFCNEIALCSDGGIAVGGSTGLDAYLAKVSAAGVKTFEKSFVANGTEAFNSTEQTSDGGYILCGYKNSVLYLVKTDKDGNSN
jgi:PKD repeat protein